MFWQTESIHRRAVAVKATEGLHKLFEADTAGVRRVSQYNTLVVSATFSIRWLLRNIYTIPPKMINHPQLSPDVAFEEVIADMCESFLTDIHLTDKASQLYTENPQAANKLTAILHKLIDRIRELYSRFKPTSEIGQMTKAAVKDIEGAFDRYLAGIRAASENLRNMEKPATEGGAKYMAREFTGERNYVAFRDKQTIGKAIQKTKNSIIAQNGQVKIEKANIDDEKSATNWTVAKEGRNRIKSILQTALGEEVTLGKDNQTILARLTREGLNHALKGKNDEQKAAIYRQFIELAGSSIYSYSTEQDREHSASSNRIAENASWDSFVAVADYRGQNIPVVFVVRSIDTDIRGQIYESWIKKEVKATHGAGTQKDSVNSQPNYDDQLTSKNSIHNSNKNSNTSTQKNQSRSDADYLSAVKRSDTQAAQRMVDEAAERAFAKSKIRDEDGKLMKDYHGTDADFTVSAFIESGEEKSNTLQTINPRVSSGVSCC